MSIMTLQISTFVYSSNTLYNLYVLLFIYSYIFYFVKALDSQSMGPVLKTIGWLQGRSAFHPSEFDQMTTMNFFWKLT